MTIGGNNSHHVVRRRYSKRVRHCCLDQNRHGHADPGAGTNTYTGATTVSNGTLLVNGSTASGSAASVSSGTATLGGSGTVSGTLSDNGIHLSGPIVWFQWNWHSDHRRRNLKYRRRCQRRFDGPTWQHYDKLVNTGTAVALGNATLNVSLASGYIPAYNSTYTIATGTSGTFSKVNYPTGIPFQITYSGGNVQLTSLVSATANGQSLSTNENTAKTVTLTGSDTGSYALTYAIVSGPAYGTVTNFNSTTGTFTYTPTTGYSGSDSLTFTATDGTNTSTAATVSITVITPAVPPTVTLNTTAMLDKTPTLTITGTGFDPSGTTVTFNDGAVGILTSFSPTSLTVSFTTPPTAAGILLADVTTPDGSSGFVQVATVVFVTNVAVNGDYAPIVGMVDTTSNGVNTVTVTTDGNHGFTANNTVVISGYTDANAGYNGTFTIVSASGNTFTVTNSTANLPTLTGNNQGFAISQNTTSALLGKQRSIVDSVAYTFSSPLSLRAANFTLATATARLTITGQSPSTTVPGMVVTTFNGGTAWVVSWSSGTGHSIANGVYQVTLVNSNQAADTFFRLYGDQLGYQSGAAAVNSSDTASYNLTYGKSSGTAGYLAGLDYLGTGSINSSDTSDYNLFYGTIWSDFTPTI